MASAGDDVRFRADACTQYSLRLSQMSQSLNHPQNVLLVVPAEPESGDCWLIEPMLQGEFKRIAISDLRHAINTAYGPVLLSPEGAVTSTPGAAAALSSAPAPADHAVAPPTLRSIDVLVLACQYLVQAFAATDNASDLASQHRFANLLSDLRACSLSA